MDDRAIVDKHLPDLDQEWRSTVERLVAVILGELPDPACARKWGQLTFARNGDWHHWICAISPSTKAVKLMIHKGALLADPHDAMEGNGRYVRTIRFQAPDDINPDVVAPIRQTEMLPSSAVEERWLSVAAALLRFARSGGSRNPVDTGRLTDAAVSIAVDFTQRNRERRSS